MGWWSGSTNSWDSWGSWRSPSRSPVRRRYGPTTSWGQWKCACGNVQSGSQCKGCRSKYWEVEWEAVPSSPGAGGRTPATRAPWAKPDKVQPKASRTDADPLTHLDQFLSSATLATELEGPAAALRNQLRIRAPASSKRQKLKSVMDKIDHHKSQIHKAKKRLKEIEAERSALEEQLTELDGGLAALEQDKETLCTLVGAGGLEDTSSESGSEPTDGSATPTPARTEAFLSRLDPHRVLQWAQAQVFHQGGGPPPNGPRPDPAAYYIGADADMNGEDGG